MAAVGRTGLTLLLFVFQLEGGKGDDVLYRRTGKKINLRCATVLQGYPECSSTTWIYTRDRRNAAVEVVTLGKPNKDPLGPSKATRLSFFKANCSLTVHDVRAEDAGHYTCQQWTSTGSKYEEKRIDLSVLSVTREGLNSLKCSLTGYETTCVGSSVMWLYEGGTQINQDISQVSCSSTLPSYDPDNKVRCQLLVGGKKKTFIDFPPASAGSGTETGSGTATTPATEPESSSSGLSQTQIYIIVGVAVAVGGLVVFSVLLLRRRQREAERRAPGGLVALDVAGDTNPVSSHAHDSGLTYASIKHSAGGGTGPKAPPHAGEGAGEAEGVTYATVRASAREPADPSHLYAQVGRAKT